MKDSSMKGGILMLVMLVALLAAPVAVAHFMMPAASVTAEEHASLAQ